MRPFRGQLRKKDPTPAPGDDVVPVPPPVTEEPPHDRYCDLVLTGGVASGVVYPWAIVELARKYRFRNIGGTSVGAMAAALAAAAEYGRRTGYEAPFEPLRRAPASLGTIYPDGRTRMLSLFQTNPHGRRLIWLWGEIFRGETSSTTQAEDQSKVRCPVGGACARGVRLTIVAYWQPMIIGAAVGGAVASLLMGLAPHSWAAWLIVLVDALGCAIAALVLALWRDIRRGIIDNSYGLCKGGTLAGDGGPPGITQWLHDGIQASAGLDDDELPLTFRDLWTAPDYPGAERRPCERDDAPGKRAINLQMLTTNVTHGRPYRLPMVDSTSRLFFRPKELEDYFPPCVLHALVESATPYAPQGKPGRDPALCEKTTEGMLELPAEDLPVVVAARLSLSFPLLFSAVPLWAIDYEAPFGARTLRRCLFTDGGASSNFPIHLFDAAVPRWPTFGLWLDRRGPYRRGDSDDKKASDKRGPKAADFKTETPEETVWLPEFNGQGYGDSWNRFDPESKAVDPDPRPVDRSSTSANWTSTLMRCPQARPGCKKDSGPSLLGFLSGLATSATDWHDRTNFRLPHIRNRVARLLLLPGEGGLHIGMSRKQILEMADRYGTQAGKKFVQRFADSDGQPTRAWKEQRWIRFNLLVNALRETLDGLTTSAAWSTRTVPLERAIDAATQSPGPVSDNDNCQQVKLPDGKALTGLLHDLEQLEIELRATPKVFESLPEPELRVSSRL